MQLRRSARLLTAAGALLLAAPVLTSCGFDNATDRVYTPGAGSNDQTAEVDVLGAVVVSAQDGSGTLIASFSNNVQTRPLSVTAITAKSASGDLTVGDFDPIEVPEGGLVNLADADTPITLEGDFTTGQFVTLTFTFSEGKPVTLKVPSYADCYEYAGLDATATTPTAAEDCKSEVPASEG